MKTIKSHAGIYLKNSVRFSLFKTCNADVAQIHAEIYDNLCQDLFVCMFIALRKSKTKF